MVNVPALVKLPRTVMADVAGEVAGRNVLAALLARLLKDKFAAVLLFAMFRKPEVTPVLVTSLNVLVPELTMLTVLFVPLFVTFTTPDPFVKFRTPVEFTCMVPNCQPNVTVPVLGA